MLHTYTHYVICANMNSITRMYTASGAFMGTVVTARCALGCSAQSTWRQTLFRFYLDGCWKFSEQHFSLMTAPRLKHIHSSLSCKKHHDFSFLVCPENCIRIWLLLHSFRKRKETFSPCVAMYAKRQRLVADRWHKPWQLILYSSCSVLKVVIFGYSFLDNQES